MSVYVSRRNLTVDEGIWKKVTGIEGFAKTN
jgi:hypothetical protein